MAWERFHGQGGRGRAWKEGEDRQVLAATEYGTDDALARRLGRTVPAIRSRRMRLKRQMR